MYTVESHDRFVKVTPHERAEVELVLTAYRSVCTRFAYASSPIVSGKQLYTVLEQFGVKHIADAEKLSSNFISERVKPVNVFDGNTFARHVAYRLPGRLPVVSPTFFESATHGTQASRMWTQDQFMLLWLTLINSSVEEIYFNDGWEYAHGCTEEFVHVIERIAGLRKGIPVKGMYDARGNELNADMGAGLILKAFLDLEKRGFFSATLRVMYGRLVYARKNSQL